VSVAAPIADVRGAARRLAAIGTAERNAALEQIAQGLERRCDEILAANAIDAEAAAGERPAIRDRLALDPGRVADLAAAVRAVAQLTDPVGQTIREFTPPSGIHIRKLRVPLGVVLVVYEARPNVTVDAAALCLKSANACILRGSRMAAHTNRVLVDVVQPACPPTP
jgi:glutamate-5-semialdehyde dehydrogenase